MATLERRIQALEAADSRTADTLPPIVIRFIPAKDGRPAPLGELLGFQTQGGYVKRKPHETEEALLERALEIAEQSRAPRSCVSVIEDRADVA